MESWHLNRGIDGEIDTFGIRIAVVLVSLAAAIALNLQTTLTTLFVLFIFSVSLMFVAGRGLPFERFLLFFLAMTPVWVYLQWVEGPAVEFGGGQLYLLTSVKDVLLILFFLFWLGYLALDKEVIGSNVLSLPLLGYLAIVVIGVLRDPSAISILGSRGYLELLIALYLPLMTLPLTERFVKKLIWVMITVGGVTACIALINFFIDPRFLITELTREEYFENFSAYYETGRRLLSFVGNPNRLGIIMVITNLMIIGLFPLYGQRKLKRSTLTVLFLLSLVVIILTRSRSAWFSWLIGVLVFTYFNKSIRTFLVTVGCASLGFLLFWELIKIGFIQLLSGNPRFAIWPEYLRTYLLSSPPNFLLGLGIGQWLAVGTYQTRLTISGGIGAPDSTYIKMIIETGAIGLIFFMLLNLGFLKSGLQHIAHTEGTERQIRILAFCILVALLANFVPTTHFYVFPITMYYWLFAALLKREVPEPSPVDLRPCRGPS